MSRVGNSEETIGNFDKGSFGTMVYSVGGLT